jgi:ABC-type Na+ efflux pump permease subunit
MAAPILGLWNAKQMPLQKSWWRFIWAAILSVPLAVVIRGFILNTPTIGIFVLVMVAFSIFGLLIWRLVWQLFLRQKS